MVIFHCGLFVLLSYRWLGGVVVRALDLRFSVVGSSPGHDTAWLFLRLVTVFGGIGFATFGRGIESRSWHCLVISEIGDRLWWVNYLGM